MLALWTVPAGHSWEGNLHDRSPLNGLEGVPRLDRMSLCTLECCDAATTRRQPLPFSGDLRRDLATSTTSIADCCDEYKGEVWDVGILLGLDLGFDGSDGGGGGV